MPQLIDFLSEPAQKLLVSQGPALVKQLGIEVVRAVVYDILLGKNVRSSTEMLTRKRISLINLALVDLFLQAQAQGYTPEDLLELSLTTLKRPGRGQKKAERWLGQWLLGLTDKGVQNILWDDYSTGLERYKAEYFEVCQGAAKSCEAEYGILSGQLTANNLKLELSWFYLLSMLNSAGAMTLTIRGSEKSTYGKLFEKLVLSSFLQVLDFKLSDETNLQNTEGVYWLSSTDKRESDATLLLGSGKGVRFDIGFIGRGNSELPLDKVARFQNNLTRGPKNYYMATIIIIDKMGKKSKLEAQAQEIGGNIVQMSMSLWPQQVARILHEKVGYENPLVTMPSGDVPEYLKHKLAAINLEKIIAVLPEESESDEEIRIDEPGD